MKALKRNCGQKPILWRDVIAKKIIAKPEVTL